MYKLDTLLLKQKNLPELDITGFFFRIRTPVTALMRRPSLDYSFGKKKPVISNTGRFNVSIVLHLILNDTNTPNIQFG